MPLRRFSKEETETMIESAKKIPDIVGLIVKGKPEEAMNLYNRSEGGK